MPRRRAGLVSGGPPHRRGRLAPVSEVRRNRRGAAQPIIDAVFARDGGCILRRHVHVVGRCYGAPMTPHHLRKAGQGGTWTASNLVTLCAFHNGWVENWPQTAHRLGLVIRTGEIAADAWARMRAAGLSVGPEHDPATGGQL